MTAPTRGPSGRSRARYIWGFADQAVSSATNFGLFLIAGRQLGPHGLGVVTIGISAYLLVLGFQRSLLTTPLVSSSAALVADERSLAIRRGLAVQLAGAITSSVLLLLLGLALRGGVASGFLFVAPWLALALIQDFWRAVLFQEERPRAAAVNDAAWFLVLALMAPFTWLLPREWTIIGCWGLGAAAAATFGFAQTGIRPLRDGAFSWWRTRLWPFGRWLGLESVAYSVATSGTVFILYGIIGASAVGGLRAAQSLFAPLSLILPAIALPGLPAVARALGGSASAGPALRLAAVLSGVTGALAGAYVGVMVLLGGRLIPSVFGSSFSTYADLAWPIGAWQLALALGAGFAIFLTAQQRGRALFLIRAAGAVASVAFVSLFAWMNGVVGAAWGLALGGATATVLTMAVVARSNRGPVAGDAPSAGVESGAGW